MKTAAKRVKAYVLIETSAGKAKTVKKALARVKGGAGASVVTLDAITGPYDFVAVIEGATLDAIGRLVTDGIGAIDGVTRTTTCMAVALS
jgi:DNA-binding Lrp family transcriptional regulator